MSLLHRSDHAAAWSANSRSKPLAAAAREAAIADASGEPSVSTPTNLLSSYLVPALTGNVTASRVVSALAVGLIDWEDGCTPEPVASVEATAPGVPSVCVVNVTSIVPGALATL